ncbi:transmembrane protein 33-like [Patiria miniata]|uniref:Transmembrane protein 33 n=1 Tax=Patiria miniata TaxID=46514 RepID=A0A913ZY47_PATMI|nr:transmembrane protein 33-like [Patiria miniata]
MPTIEEVSDDEAQGSQGTTQSGTSSSSNQSENGDQGGGFAAVGNYLANNKLDFCLWMSRMVTVICSLFYLVPIYGPQSAYGFYQRAIICNGLTSALRLQQRLPTFQFNRVYLSLLLLEDSCHNLFFSLIFVNSHPITLALAPPFLFALLHASNFIKKLLNIIGPNSVYLVRKMVDNLITRQSQILRFIALDEIILMPFLIFMVFTGRVSFLVPFMYFRFLTFRYASRRNPYCKQIFHELRIVTENYCSKPNTPAFLRNFLTKCIGMISRFAPPIQQQ